MEVKPMPCPFCWKEPWLGSIKGGFAIECNNLACVAPSCSAPTVEAVLAGWNHRPAPPCDHAAKLEDAIRTAVKNGEFIDAYEPVFKARGLGTDLHNLGIKNKAQAYKLGYGDALTVMKAKLAGLLSVLDAALSPSTQERR